VRTGVLSGNQAITWQICYIAIKGGARGMKGNGEGKLGIIWKFPGDRNVRSKGVDDK